MLLQELQIVFTLLTCLSGTSSREKFKDLYYFTWVSLGSWRRKLEFSDIWPYLSTFGHLATSFKTFTVTFTFCPGAWKIHSLTQNAALLRQNFTALELRGYLDINSWLWAFSDENNSPLLTHCYLTFSFIGSLNFSSKFTIFPSHPFHGNSQFKVTLRSFQLIAFKCLQITSSITPTSGTFTFRDV